MTSIDLNCDMGESYGTWTLGADGQMMPHITSANIACGFHGGDPPTIEKTIRLALKHGVSVGAHPSYPDLQGFGRRSMKLTPDEIRGVVLYQVAALEGMARAAGSTLHHVKLHGAMYNDLARFPHLAEAAVAAVMSLNAELLLYTLAGCPMVRVARDKGARVVEEAFGDRRYNSDGTLQSRHIPGALITDPDEAAAQVRDIAVHGRVTAHDGTPFLLSAETICIHGDNPAAVEIARAVRNSLSEAKVQVSSAAPAQ